MTRRAPADTSLAVDAFMQALEHPAKPLIGQLRRTVLDTDAAVAEGVKWSAPSFRTTEYFATMNLRAKAGVGLVLHFGAKLREVAAGPGTIDDPQHLLQWVAKDRATIGFSDAQDLDARRAALQAILRQWIRHV